MGNNFTLSATTPLMGNNASNTVIASVYPNPVRDRLFVQLEGTTDQACFVRLTDQLGRTVYGQHHELDGINNISIPTSALPSGMYLLNIIVDGKMQTERVVVSH